MEAFKMRYPMSMRLARQMEEMGELVEGWSSRAGGTASKEELLLERLPYVARIEGRKGGGGEVERITTFRGIGAAGEEMEDEEEAAGGGLPAALDGGVGVGGGKGTGAGTGLEEGVEKLWLSEDDIEDC